MSQVKIFVSFFFGISIVEAIIGGESVLNPHEFPWMVGVRTKSGKCGGSVITKNLVMTAAHCIFNSKTQELNQEFSILMGHSNISSTLIKKGSVESVLVHPQNDNKQYYNDIALLRLTKDLEFDNSVQPIALPNNGITSDLLLLGNQIIGFIGVFFITIERREMTKNAVCSRTFSKIPVLDALEFFKGSSREFLCHLF